jgi:starch-binding outer membrane protein, SusD/RagB family
MHIMLKRIIMNKITIKPASVLTLLILVAGSCGEDFLDQKPTSSFTDVLYYKNAEELETGLVACYASVRQLFEGAHWMIGDLNSDDGDAGSHPGDIPELYDIAYSRQNASNSWIGDFWMEYYAIIARCNEVIDKSAGVKGDAVTIGKIVNQAKFLRAMCYYHLVTVFGEVPLVDHFLSPNGLDLKRASVADIWALVESDLKEATHLPTVSKWDQSGRITSGAAYALLGKVYLTEKKYPEANSAFYKVVSSHEYQLVSDFGLIFRHDGENCVESVVEFQNMVNISGGNMGTVNPTWRMPRDVDANGWGFDCPTTDLYHEFEEGDPRIIYTFMFKGDVFPGPEGRNYTVENAESPSGYNCRKIWVPWSERTGLQFYELDYNYRYMRYAEVLLLYAESLNETGKPDSSLMLVNQVRERARATPAVDLQRISCAHDLSYSGELLPDVTTHDQGELRKAIWHEERVELATEGHRRNMLLRMEQFRERMEAAKGGEGCTVEPYELLFPIPQQEIEISDGVLVQNLGY